MVAVARIAQQTLEPIDNARKRPGFPRPRRVLAAFRPMVRAQCEGRGTGRVAGMRGGNRKLTVFLERRLTATWLLVDQRNHLNSKERRECAASLALTTKSARHRAWSPALAIAGCASKKTPNSAADLGLGAERQRRARRRTSPSMSATASSSTPIPRSIRADAQATLSKQAQWLNQYGNYAHHRRRPCRRTRHPRIQPGARRPPRRRHPRLPDRAGASPVKRLKTISYGKERPVAVCDDISCWSQNRRAVTVLNGARQLSAFRQRHLQQRRPLRPPFSCVAARKQNLAELCGPDKSGKPRSARPSGHYFQDERSDEIPIHHRQRHRRFAASCGTAAWPANGTPRRASGAHRSCRASFGRCRASSSATALPKPPMRARPGGRSARHAARRADPQARGTIEELNFQVLQMQEQMRKMQEDNEFRFQELEGKRSDAGGRRQAAERRPRRRAPKTPHRPQRAAGAVASTQTDTPLAGGTAAAPAPGGERRSAPSPSTATATSPAAASATAR